MNPFIHPAMGEILQLLFFKKYGYGIRLHKKVDVPLKQRNKIKPIKSTFIMETTETKSFKIFEKDVSPKYP